MYSFTTLATESTGGTVQLPFYGEGNVAGQRNAGGGWEDMPCENRCATSVTNPLRDACAVGELAQTNRAN